MPIEKCVPVKQEDASTGGDPNDAYELLNAPANPYEDALEARGYYIANDTTRDTQVLISRDASNNMTFKDGVAGGGTTTYTLTDLISAGGGISATQHENLDSLTHWIVENSYDVLTYTGNKVTNVTTWTNNLLTTKIRESQISYTGNKVAQCIEIQYDASGVELYRVTDVFAYSGNNIVSVTRTRV